LLEFSKDSTVAQHLKTLIGTGSYYSMVLDQRISILDLLEKYPSIDLPFEQFLTLLPPLRLRHYSISSSPLHDPHVCTLTYSVLDEPSLSDHEKRFQGVTGSYLRSLKEGDQILVSVRSTNKFFRLPTDVEKTPLLMFCAGSGIAPFRGFVQERGVLIKEGGRELAPALLFVGCRSRTLDRLYGAEFDEWVRLGAVDIRYAFSTEQQESECCKYVQDRIVKDKDDVYKLWEQGAKVYICGSNRLSKGVGEAARAIMKERSKQRGKELSDEDLHEWFSKMRNERFVADVFD
jgi:cytochrome P450 / NADPH-cytochrome P450 reductase